MALQQQPLVSVVMSVRNRSAMLLDCLRGLGAQTLGVARFEVIVIDNCSAEALEPVLEEGRRHWGLTIRSQRTLQDRGPAPARNLGVQLARGEIIAFIDSDCRPSPDWLARSLVHFELESVALVSGPVLPKPEQRATFTSKLSFVTASEHPTFPTANLLVRRDVFIGLGGFDETLSFRDPFDRATECADTDLAWKIIEAGHDRRFDADAVMLHEVERLGLAMWLLEPTRLFLLPELVRRHPRLRSVLLRGRYFFYPRAIIMWAVVAVLVAVAFWEPLGLLALPAALLLWAMWRTRSLDPVRLLRFSAKAPFHAIRMLVMSAALLYGSVRFRSLVL